MSRVTITDVNLAGAKIEDCNIDGLMIEGFDVSELIEEEKKRRQRPRR